MRLNSKCRICAILFLFGLVRTVNAEILIDQADTDPPFLGQPLRGAVKSDTVELRIRNFNNIKLIEIAKDGVPLKSFEIPKNFEVYSTVSNNNGFWFMLRSNETSGIKPICIVHFDSDLGARFYSVKLPRKSRIFSVVEAADKGLIVICSAVIKIGEKPIKYVIGMLPYAKLKLIENPKLEDIGDVDPDLPLEVVPRRRVSAPSIK